jgi:hypothetical protein
MGLDNNREMHQKKTETTDTSSHSDYSAPDLRGLQHIQSSYSGSKAQTFIQTNYPPLLYPKDILPFVVKAFIMTTWKPTSKSGDPWA